MNLETEATLQAEFYHACRLLNLTCVLELVTPVGRLDAAILTPDKSTLLAVVEVKRNEFSFLEGRSEQIQRYKRLGVEVYGIWIGEDAHKLAATIKRECNGLYGVRLSQLDAWRGEKERERQDQKQLRKEYRLARFKKYHPHLA